jgi:hypothetical protein
MSEFFCTQIALVDSSNESGSSVAFGSALHGASSFLLKLWFSFQI